jgi:hypothetical protein
MRLRSPVPQLSSSALRTSQPSLGRFLGGDPWMVVVPPTTARTSTYASSSSGAAATRAAAGQVTKAE